MESESVYDEPVFEYWLCAGPCGDWKKGMAAAHNGSGPVCGECDRASRVHTDCQPDYEDYPRGN